MKVLQVGKFYTYILYQNIRILHMRMSTSFVDQNIKKTILGDKLGQLAIFTMGFWPFL